MRRAVIICAYFFFTSVFADFPSRNSLTLSTALYRYSYSEEFGSERGHIGFPRSDEYGPTAGVEAGYNFFDAESKFTFGFNFNLSRSIKHTYDGSLQGKFFPFIKGVYKGGELVYENDSILYYQPLIESTDNYFYGADIKLGYVIPISRQAIFEPKITTTFDCWVRPVEKHLVEDYLWLRIRPGVSLITKSGGNLGVVSDLALSIPVWQRMYWKYGGESYKLKIGGKAGWQFKFGFARYYAEDLTLKIVYSYEYYGFKESPPIYFAAEDGQGIYEPSSATRNNGVKISLQKGFGI